MDLKERIVNLCKERKIPVRKLEDDLGFAGGYISKLSKSTPNTDKINQIANYFSVSLDYLVNGKEPALESYPEQAEMLVKIRNDKDLMSAIEKYYALSDANKQLVIQMIGALSKG